MYGLAGTHGGARDCNRALTDEQEAIVHTAVRNTREKPMHAPNRELKQRPMFTLCSMIGGSVRSLLMSRGL